jgi:hypothetical protein
MTDFSYAKACAKMINDASEDIESVLDTIEDRYDDERFSDQDEMRQIVQDQLSDIREDCDTIENLMKDAFEDGTETDKEGEAS